MRAPRLRRAVRLFKDQLAKDRSPAIVCKVMYLLDSILANAQECAPVAQNVVHHRCARCGRRHFEKGRYCSPECWTLDNYAPEKAPPKKKLAIVLRKERRQYQPLPTRNCGNPNCGKPVEFRRGGGRYCSIDCLEQGERMHERRREIRPRTALQTLRNLGFDDAIIDERNRTIRERIALQILRELGFTNAMIDETNR